MKAVRTGVSFRIQTLKFKRTLIFWASCQTVRFGAVVLSHYIIHYHLIPPVGAERILLTAS